MLQQQLKLAMSSFKNDSEEECLVGKDLPEISMDEGQQMEQTNAPSESPARATAIHEDHAFIKEFVTPAAVIMISKEFITLTIIRTQYARVQLRVRFTENYPDELPTVELTSPTLPLPLLQNKEKECLDNARPLLGQSLIRAIYEPIYKFIHTNMFIPCWKEMKQLIALCEGKGKVGADEKEGTIVMRLVCGKYKHVVKLKVPFNYPEEGVKIEFPSTNFPDDIRYMFLSQAEDIVRRCVAGCTIEQALQVSNPIKLADTAAKATASAPRITADNLKSLKHDVEVLKQISDLRVATTAASKKYYVQVNAERREARRDLRKLAKAESEADQQEHKAMLEQEQQEMKELLKGKVSDVAQPSLYAVARFLVEDFACRLPLEPCQACQKPVLPAQPESEVTATAANMTSKAKNARHNMRPMRTFCGHWLHHSCLNEWLSTPPFVRHCPVCSRRIWHPDWPEDYRQLEKAWQAQEARKREMNDPTSLYRYEADVVVRTKRKPLQIPQQQQLFSTLL